MRPELMNALAVAYLGDAVFEVYVREYLLTEKGSNFSVKSIIHIHKLSIWAWKRKI